MSRVLLLDGVLFWAGATLVLSRARWFRRRSLLDRLRAYEPGGLTVGRAPVGIVSVDSVAQVVAPIARQLGSRVSRLVGIDEDLSIRLERVNAPTDATGFRLRQFGWSAAGLTVGTILAAVIGPPVGITILFLFGPPALAFLYVEQQLITASDRRRRRLFLELPVVSEQLGMLLSAGYSLGSALSRLASRGTGVTGDDLRRVVARMRHGVGELEALREWADLAGVPALDRLVAVLALNREAGDLGRLIAEEARSIRREVQRERIEQIERRSQQVWIPVTVSALVPGALFIAVPFLEALRAFTAT